MKISIVTPCFNSGAYLEKTIQSIEAQGFPQVEHIVMDGGSKDNTLGILRSHPDINWRSEPDKGQSDALNKGFRLATGDILAWQNADDLYLPGAFAAVAKTFAENPDIDLVYGDYQLVRNDGSWICDVHPIDWDQWKFSHGRFVPMQPTAFWRRRVYETVGELDIGLHYCMDVDFFARASKTFRYKRIPSLLGQFRVHDESKTMNKANKRKVSAEYRSVLARHFEYSRLDHFWFDFFRIRSIWARRVKTAWLKKA